MKKVQFEEIIKKAWALAKTNRVLWLFGVFTGGGVFFSYQTDNLDMNNPAIGEMLKKFFSSFKEPMFLWVLLGAALMFVVALIISFIARAAMLHGIDAKEKTGEAGSFKQLLKFGFLKSGKVILMEIIFFMPLVLLILLVSLVLLALPAVIKIAVFVGAILLLLYLIIISFFRFYSYCFLVYENFGPVSAVKSGWNLFANNLLTLIRAGALKFVLLIAAGLGTLIVLVIATLPLLLVGVLLLIFAGNAGFYVLTGIGLISLFFVFMIIRGFLNTFFYAYSVFIYRQLK